jgi:restriction system protein
VLSFVCTFCCFPIIIYRLTTSWQWVTARFQDLGYSIKTIGTQGDHGVDIVAQKDEETAVVQCKKFITSTVGEPKLRDLYGAMHDFGANRAFLVTTGSLTKPAKDWIKGKPIGVWDGDYIVKLSMSHKTTTIQPDDR